MSIWNDSLQKPSTSLGTPVEGLKYPVSQSNTKKSVHLDTWAWTRCPAKGQSKWPEVSEEQDTKYKEQAKPWGRWAELSINLTAVS